MQLLLSDLSVINLTCEDSLVPIKCYFDGGNQAQPEQYKVITLAAIPGTKIQWDNLESRWQGMLDRHGLTFVHTTDMVSLQNAFSPQKGWTQERVDHALDDAVTTLLHCRAGAEGGLAHGVMPITVTIGLNDFKQAVAVLPILGRPEMHAAMGCVQMCGHWCDLLRFNTMQLIFDQGEPYFGHIKDRRTNPRSIEDEAIWKHVIASTEADHRMVKGLQVADLVAWCVGHRYEQGITRTWQERFLEVHKGDIEVYWSKARLLTPNMEAINCFQRWRLPPRRSFLKGPKRRAKA